ncbi:DUF397 domain-containing protein [Solihabitans fulvus]|uniref:DUF397 domain-containing protein n=1 Tax=Solihabitans fulvus TaxID=1892852 RepID=A0A5B2X6E2_9PSEU|nr:DUF397 domain-containing protein [Solihabitans fulvus]KAA2258814.1 DUF397 domain-containing protein [Solihabitans fulvus]
MIDIADASWKKSSKSGSTSECVEVARLKTVGALRDSKNPAGPVLVFPLAQLGRFLAGARAGQFQHG